MRLPSPHLADEAGLAAVNRLLRDRAHRNLVMWLGETFTERLVSGDATPCVVALPIAPTLGDIRAAFADMPLERVRLVGPQSANQIDGDAEMADVLANGWVVLSEDSDAPLVLSPLISALEAALLGPVRVVLAWTEGTGLAALPGWADFERLFVVVGTARRVSLSAWDRSDQLFGTVALAPGSALRVPPGVVAASTSLDAEGGIVELDLRPLPASASDREEATARAALPSPAGGVVVDEGPTGRRVIVGTQVLGTLESLGPMGLRRRLADLLPYGAHTALDGRDEAEEPG